MPSKLHRPDVDALRALAVLAVVSRHSRSTTLIGRQARPAIVRCLNDS